MNKFNLSTQQTHTYGFTMSKHKIIKKRMPLKNRNAAKNKKFMLKKGVQNTIGNVMCHDP